MARKAAAKPVEKETVKKPKRDLDDLENLPPVEDSGPGTFVSTGLTLLNLALTDDPFKGWRLGGFHNLVGHSSSGKTFLALTGMAEMSIDERFSHYRLIHDNVEDGALMNIEQFFGPAAAARIRLPYKNPETGLREASDTVEDFYDNAHRHVEARPMYYCLDSQDALSSTQEIDKDELNRDLREKGKEEKGSYGDGKAAYHSRHLRQLTVRLVRTNSLLLMLSQTRETLDPMAMSKWVRSGGKALKFYAQSELWLAPVKTLTKVVNEKPRVIGGVSEIKITKNRVTGKPRTIRFSFYYETGIDDVMTSLEWMIEEGFWKTSGTGIVTAPEFKFVGKKREFCRLIEEGNQREEFASIVGVKWKELEEKMKAGRKSKYSTDA